MSGHQGHDHSHAVVTEGNAKKLTIALVLTSTFLIVEEFILSKGKKSKSIFWPSKDSSEIGIFLSIISRHF